MPDTSANDTALKNLVVQQIPLRLIKPNPENRLVTQDMVEDMTASITAAGLKNAVKMRPLPDGTFDLFSGHVRLAAAQKLGWETIAAYVMDITPEEAVEIGILDNRNKKQTWLDNYIDIEKLQAVKPKITNQELADRLNDGVSVSAINRGKRLLKCLNPSSRALINQSITKSRAAQAKSVQTLNSSDEGDRESIQSLNTSTKIWELTEDPVYRLTDLKDPELVFKSLLVVIDGQMTAPQVQKLVEWVQAGNQPETFTGHKTPKTPKPKPAPGLPPEAIDQLVELGKQWGLAEGRGEDPIPAQDKLKAFRESLTPITPAVPTSQTVKVVSPEGRALIRQKLLGSVGPWFKHILEKFAKLSVREAFKLEHRLCRKLAHAAVPLHSSHTHSGSSRSRKGLGQGLMTAFLTILHWFVYTLIQFIFWWGLVMWTTSRFVPFLRPWFEWPFRCAARLVIIDVPAWAWGWAFGHLIPAILAGLCLCWCYFYAWKQQPTRMFFLSLALGLFYFYGRGWAEQTPPLFQTAKTEAPTPVPASQSPSSTIFPKVEVSVSHLIPEKKTEKPKSAIVYEPAISFVPTAFDPKHLETEIAAVPKNSVVKDYPLSPDETMPPDLAFSRLQDLINADKYTMKIGDGTQKILSVTPTNTNLTVSYKSTDPLNGIFGGGPGQMNFIWEDVKAIHANEIDVQTKTPIVLYQCSLIVEGAKQPFTIQCSSPKDLEHLVSTMEYFVRHSRLEHDTALGGMPYTTLGMRFDSDGVIEKIWADSPADNAGLGLGDMIWSLDKNTESPQDRKKMEAGLTGPSEISLYVVDAAIWNKGKENASVSPAALNPKRRKVTVTVL
jgi:ParB/RepB/Spo0J family partition protein